MPALCLGDDTIPLDGRARAASRLKGSQIAMHEPVSHQLVGVLVVFSGEYLNG